MSLITKSAEHHLLFLLKSWVRLLSEQQVADFLFPWCPSRVRRARLVLKRLEAHGIIKRRTVLARPTRPVELLASVAAGEEGAPPDFAPVAQRIRASWGAAPAVRTHVVMLSSEGAKQCGVRKPRRIRNSEVSHDLQMAEVALRFFAELELVRKWWRDDHLAATKRWGKVVPDAEVEFQSGKRFVIECCGLYSAKKLRSFHDAIAPQLAARGVHGYWLF